MGNIFSGAQYHHVGIPTIIPQPDERYSEKFKMYTSQGHNPFRVQYHRFEEECPLHHKIQTMTHVCFKVSDIEKLLVGQTILIELYCPFEGYKAPMIEIEGAPIELIETTMTEEENWNDNHEGSYMYSSKS